MSKESLPIYQIQDFENHRINSSAFYYSGLGSHLEKHKFIQIPHKHDFFILMLVTVGTGNHSIDFRNYEVNPGTAFFLKPGQVHSWQLSKDTDGHILFFNSGFYREGFPGKNLDRFTFFSFSHFPASLTLDPEKSREIEFLFSEINREVSASLWSKKEILRSFTEILLIKLSRIYHYANGLGATVLPSEDQFKTLESYIESEFRLHREASFYAEKMHLSLKQLNRLTKHTTGKAISQLLLDRVILESQRLLTYSDKSISEIAVLLGFQDPSYFTRLFRKKIGQTPEQFRKSVR
ncbi:MAG TPA: AraC family transcriptional regulator [Algoriphagus sp.]|nr:AraC family transcriptional regulator [Algoriphagus sp.]